MKVLVLVLAGLLGTGSVIAQDVTTLAEFEKKTMTSPCSAATFRTLGAGEGSEVAENSNDFEKLGFGGGYAALISVGDGDRIEDAQLVNDIVRVTKDQNVQFGPVLEMHKFIGALSSQTLYEIDGQWRLAEDLPEKCADVLENFQRKRVPLVGVGPFVTVRLGGSEVVQSFGAGVMFGFRTAEREESEPGHCIRHRPECSYSRRRNCRRPGVADRRNADPVQDHGHVRFHGSLLSGVVSRRIQLDLTRIIAEPPDRRRLRAFVRRFKGWVIVRADSQTVL